MIQIGTFGRDIFEPILNAITGPNDYYLLGADFASYLDAQDSVDAAYAAIATPSRC